jgi:hypothetical protein
MQQNFPKAVITAIALAFGLVADVPSEFIRSMSLIRSSTLLERSSLGEGIYFANVQAHLRLPVARLLHGSEATSRRRDAGRR